MTQFFTMLEEGPGYDLVLWFQSWRTEFISAIFLPFDFLASPAFYLIFIPLFFWCIDKKIGKELFFVALSSVSLNVFFKELLARPRPFSVHPTGKEPIIPSIAELPSYGIPSGHTMSSTTLFGFFWIKYHKIIIRVSAAILITGTAVSRLIHGVHYPQDIIAGLLLSAGVLAFFCFFSDKIARFWNHRSIPHQWILITALGMLLLALQLYLHLTGKDIHDLATVSPALLGGMSGFMLEKQYIQFSVKGNFKQHALRYVIGLTVSAAVFALIRYPSRFIMSQWNIEIAFLDYLVRFLSYFSVTFAVTFIAPAFFIKLKLADRS